MKGFWLAGALLFVMFSPASCVRGPGEKNIAMAVVAYLEARTPR